jgi:hypothetical protein
MVRDRSKLHPAILVTGDFSLDMLEQKKPPGWAANSKNGSSLHYQTCPSIFRHQLEAGAGIVKNLLIHFGGGTPLEPPFSQAHDGPSAPLLCRAYSMVGEPGVGRFWASGLSGYFPDSQELFSYPSDAAGKRLIVIYEEGNHFRRDATNLPKNIGKDAMIVYKMSGQIEGNEVLKALLTLEGHNPEKLIIVLSADQLRGEREVSISRSVSWEATATDLAFYLIQSSTLSPLFHSAHLIVLFGYEGAFYYQNKLGNRLSLFFDPGLLERQFRNEFPGEVNGQEAVFTGVIADYFVRTPLEQASLDEVIRKGLWSMREWLKAGYVLESGRLSYPYPVIAGQEQVSRNPFCEIAMPYPPSLFEPDPRYWTILDQKVGNTRRLVAENIVQAGYDPLLEQVPEIRFGKILRAMDRSEIERLSGIWKLISEYMSHPNPGRPLSLAVFGSPGSGKSFSINQIAEQIDSRRIYKMVFNLSQFRQYEELVAAFHKIRNINLTGKIPLVFFDEFDADGLKWLKFFLAPMQDGEFMDGGTTFNLGASIFVFAGGTCASFESFSAGKTGDEEHSRQVKLPDFVSRLRGFINIKGPNPVDDRYFHDYLRGEQVLWKDENYIIRRAKLIRSLLERSSHARGLFGPDGKTLQIDPGVLRALLLVPEYKHGIRSIESILEMSRLAGKDYFDKAALPPLDQLALHVDNEVFEYLLEKERFLLPAEHPLDFIARENDVVRNIAKDIHEQYLRNCRIRGRRLRVAEQFADLDQEDYLSNIHAAREIPEKLKSIRVGIREACGSGKFPVLSVEEAGKLSRWEHQRWYRERAWSGARETKPSHPFLTTWQDLPEEIQQIDYESVFALPFILEKNGLAMYRMEEIEELDPKFVESLARAVHEKYRELNPGAPPFDQLSPQLRASNLDQVMHISTRLRQVGCGLRKLPPGMQPHKFHFSDYQTERMAEWEHQRWCWEKWRQGYIFKPGEKDDENRTHPDLVPYSQLSEEKKELDRKPVREMPGLLADAGYGIYETDLPWL